MSKNILSTPIDYYNPEDYIHLLSLSLGTAYSRQLRMGELVIGDNGWNVDLSKGEIKFGDKTFKCSIIGSESNVSNTWLWGWANEGLPEGSAKASQDAKDKLPDCGEFTIESFELDDIHHGHNLSMVCVGAADENTCYYRCPHSQGALYVQIYGLPDEVFKPLTIKEIAQNYVQLIGQFYCDHFMLLAGFLYMNGYSFECTGEDGDETRSITCEADGVTLHVDYELEMEDEFYRTTGVELN